MNARPRNTETQKARAGAPPLAPHIMEYNSQRERLIIPEYGRNIQKMVNYAKGIKDKSERNKVSQAIINVMGQLNPHLRDVADFKHKLWDHLFIISDFKLDVDSPYPKPSSKILESKPDIVPYPTHRMRYRHYGYTIELLIKKAAAVKDEDKKQRMTEVIANLMKKAYLSWNRESVNDNDILEHLDILSNGELKLKDISKLVNTNDILAAKAKTVKKQQQRPHKSRQNFRQRRRN